MNFYQTTYRILNALLISNLLHIIAKDMGSVELLILASLFLVLNFCIMSMTIYSN